jgi:hypothetical protein
VCSPGGNTVTVLHGPEVEVAAEWLCEATWDGDFGAGDFDLTDIVAGSGARLRDGRVTFVSSGSTVDRLQAVSTGGRVLVSNSLPCLLQAAGGDLSRTYPRYYWDFRSIIEGLRAYHRTLETSAGRVELVYFDNLVWDGWTLRVTDKPTTGGPFLDFAGYRTFLATSMRAVAKNLADGRRARPFGMLGTTSSGYDSPTVTVLAAEAGCRRVLCFDRARDGEADSGEAIASTLGMTTTTIARAGWEASALPEVPFIAANAYGEEVHYRGAEAELRGHVLFTGYHGDKVWDKKTSDVYGEIRRGDPSGLSLTEYRLHAGFLHCPVPFWGARRVREIVAIANGPELAAWDVPGDYSRPICRRIVEEAGVARRSFGIEKHAASVVLHNQRRFLTPGSTADYLHYLRTHRRAWLDERRIPPIPSEPLDTAIAMSSRVVGAQKLARLNRFEAYRALQARLGGFHGGPTYLRRFVFPWAMERARRAYATSAVSDSVNRA